MPKPRITKNLSKPAPKVREGMDSGHLANVRKLPCCVCGIPGSTVAHHLLRTGEHGMGRKSSDKYAVPLCEGIAIKDGCHRALHNDGDEERFLTCHGIDGRALASALWAKRGDMTAMERVAFNFRQEAARKRQQAKHHGEAA
jgi:hypothetical protein